MSTTTGPAPKLPTSLSVQVAAMEKGYADMTRKYRAALFQLDSLRAAAHSAQDGANAIARLEIAKKTLVDIGYFREHEVDDDVAPRIWEYATHMQAEVSKYAELAKSLRDEVDSLKAQTVTPRGIWVRDGEPDDELVGATPGRFILEHSHGKHYEVGCLLPSDDAGRFVATYKDAKDTYGWGDTLAVFPRDIVATADSPEELEAYRDSLSKPQAPKVLLSGDCVVVTEKGGETHAAYVKAITTEGLVVTVDEAGDYDIHERHEVALRFRAGGDQ